MQNAQRPVAGHGGQRRRGTWRRSGSRKARGGVNGGAAGARRGDSLLARGEADAGKRGRGTWHRSSLSPHAEAMETGEEGLGRSDHGDEPARTRIGRGSGRTWRASDAGMEQSFGRLGAPGDDGECVKAGEAWMKTDSTAAGPGRHGSDGQGPEMRYGRAASMASCSNMQSTREG